MCRRFAYEYGGRAYGAKSILCLSFRFFCYGLFRLNSFLIPSAIGNLRLRLVHNEVNGLYLRSVRLLSKLYRKLHISGPEILPERIARFFPEALRVIGNLHRSRFFISLRQNHGSFVSAQRRNRLFINRISVKSQEGYLCGDDPCCRWIIQTVISHFMARRANRHGSNRIFLLQIAVKIQLRIIPAGALMVCLQSGILQHKGIQGIAVVSHRRA